MKNPYMKMAIWHVVLTSICLLPAIIFQSGNGYMSSALLNFVGNLSLSGFLNVCIYQNDVKKWNHIQDKEYSEWQEDIDTEYKLRKKMVDKLRLK